MKTEPQADTIRNLRVATGWSQEELASQARVGVSTVQRAERGIPIRANTLAAIAQVLGVTLGELTARDQARQNSDSTGSGPTRILGRYGPLLAAFGDTTREVLHWRRAFADTFMYRGFFMRNDGATVFVQLESVAPLASTLSLSLHRDVSEAPKILKRMHRQIEEVGGCLRGHANTGHRLSPEANAQILKIGACLCDGADFHLVRAERELREVLGMQGVA